MSELQRLQTTRRIYRVRGLRPNGRWKFRDYMTLEKAEAAASAWLKPHKITLDGVPMIEPPLTQLVILQSEPVVFLMGEDLEGREGEEISA